MSNFRTAGGERVVDSGKALDQDRVMEFLGRVVTDSGAAFAGLSTSLGVRAQKGPHALGNHAGEEAMRSIAEDAGLHRWKLAVETVTNRVYDVKRRPPRRSTATAVDRRFPGRHPYSSPGRRPDSGRAGCR